MGSMGPELGSMRTARFVVCALFAASAAIVLASLSVAADTPGLEGGGEDRLQLLASVDSSGDIVQSGSPAVLRVRVLDQFGRPVEGATVSATSVSGSVTPPATTTDVDGFARFTYRMETEAAVEVSVHFEVAKGNAFVDQAEYALIVIPTPPQRPILTRVETAVGAGIGAALLAALAGTEFGKYGLSNLILFPLYSRLRKEEVLDHFVRGQIYGFIMSHPGEHYNSLKDALKVTNGTLAHHLRTLEMQGFIKADRDGVFKRFYPVEVQIPRHRGIRLSDLQHNMLSMIRSDGGPTQHEIADQLGVSQQTVSYNLRHLNREGLVRMEKEGRMKRYFSVDLPAMDT
jgi:DNA-binding MarR family transcriptional regulator